MIQEIETKGGKGHLVATEWAEGVAIAWSVAVQELVAKGVLTEAQFDALEVQVQTFYHALGTGKFIVVEKGEAKIFDTPPEDYVPVFDKEITI